MDICENAECWKGGRRDICGMLKGCEEGYMWIAGRVFK